MMLMITDHLMMKATEILKLRSIYHYDTLIIRHVRSVAKKRTDGSCSNKIFADIKCD